MYYVSKRLEIAFAHKLTLNYESKCRQLHGHNGIVTIFVAAKNWTKTAWWLTSHTSNKPLPKS